MPAACGATLAAPPQAARAESHLFIFATVCIRVLVPTSSYCRTVSCMLPRSIFPHSKFGRDSIWQLFMPPAPYDMKQSQQTRSERRVQMTELFVFDHGDTIVNCRIQKAQAGTQQQQPCWLSHISCSPAREKKVCSGSALPCPGPHLPNPPVSFWQLSTKFTAGAASSPRWSATTSAGIAASCSQRVKIFNAAPTCPVQGSVSPLQNPRQSTKSARGR